MLNPEDRRAIEGLFDRLADVARRNPERDPEAQDLIDREIVRQPGAPYYMAQTILVQQHALEVAERRIAELERQAEERGNGGLFGGLFDDGRGRQNRNEERQPAQRSRSPWTDRMRQPIRATSAGGWGRAAGSSPVRRRRRSAWLAVCCWAAPLARCSAPAARRLPKALHPIRPQPMPVTTMSTARIRGAARIAATSPAAIGAILVAVTAAASTWAGISDAAAWGCRTGELLGMISVDDRAAC